MKEMPPRPAITASLMVSLLSISPFQATGLEEPLHARTDAFFSLQNIPADGYAIKAPDGRDIQRVIYADPEAACLMRFCSTRRSFVQDIFNGRLPLLLEKPSLGIGLWC
jgi:hypothetical protein